MKDLTLSDLIKTLNTPEKQPMDVLMSACKQAAQFIKNEQIIWKKGAEFAKLFVTLPTENILVIDEEEKDKVAPTAPVESSPADPNPQHIQGACNIYITGVRPVKGGIDRVTQLRALREASGDLNAAPRMTLQKANELLADLELGDRATLIRSMPLAEEATEIVKELAAVGIVAELRK